MRGIRTKLMMWALVILGLAMLSTTTQAASYLLMGVTNQVWKYNQTDAFTDRSWAAPGFDDSAWPSGNSVLGFEPGQPAAGLIRTPLIAPNAAGGRLTYYFRTTFTIPTGVDPSTLVLTSSNFLDDGAVFYLNGQEFMRWNVTGDSSTPSTYDTPQIAANPAPCADAQRCVLNLTNAAAFLQPGVNLFAVEVKGGGAGSSDVTWGTDLHAVVAFAPVITQQPVGTNQVLQGRSFTLSVAANGAPAPAYQWYRTDLGTPIAGANAATYTISNMDDTQAGQYHVNVSNQYGSVDSASVNVGYLADTFVPKLVSATGDPLNTSTVNLNFDESVTGAVDTFFYAIDIASGGSGPAVSAVAYNANSNTVILTLDAPLDPLVKYVVSIFAYPSLQDYFGNSLPDGTSTNIVFPAVFRQDQLGYTGTQDNELRENTPDTSGGDLAIINVDQQDPNNVHGLLRFDNIVGGGPGQIPFNSTVNSATLRIWTDDPGSSPMRVMRMLVDWNEASTWNSMVSGLDGTNGTECSALLTFSVSGDNEFDNLNVTALVQDWVNGAPNYGFGFIPIGTDGWRWATSENADTTLRPTLIVNFTARIEPCNIITPPSSVTVTEGQSFTLSVLSSGSDLRYQWFRNNVAIPGATSSSYTAVAVPNACAGGNAGTYRVEVDNDVGNPCISQNATVTVNGDTTRPTLVSAVGNPDQTTITLNFSEPMDSATAQSTGSYALSPAVAITSAVLGTNRTTVTLTTAARVPGTHYRLTVTGLKDASCAGNLLNPNPTVIQDLEQHVRIMAFDATWKYENSGCDQGTAWSGTGFNDSAWPSANAVLGFETTAATFTALFNQGLNTNNMQLLRRTNTVGCGMNGTNITDYFRTTMNIPFSLAGAVIRIRHVTDDGAVFYFNGTEVGRYNMTNAAINYLTTALSAPGEGVIRQLDVSAAPLVAGNNLFAVEVHQDSFNSSDVDWAAEVLAVYGVLKPTLRIVDNGGGPTGTITISWDPNQGTLQQRDSLTAGAWADSPGTGNPRTITKAGAARFYSLRQ